MTDKINLKGYQLEYWTMMVESLDIEPSLERYIFIKKELDKKKIFFDEKFDQLYTKLNLIKVKHDLRDS